jgi:diguanylate cyclase (GGDEF)-like protein
MQSLDAEPQHHEPSYDSLTGALTRSSFVALLQEQSAVAQRAGTVFSLCLEDLERLRNINDARGASVGDQVIAGLAARLRSVLDAPAWHRSEYTFGRHDGGALAVLARPCSANQAELLAEALRFGVSETPLSLGVAATVSIGVAQHRIGESIDQLLARAESALHIAKQFGRDRVEIARTPPSRAERAKVVGIHDRRG